MRTVLRFVAVALLVALAARAQVNSGSDGHDGVFNPTTSTNIDIDMADHPDGITTTPPSTLPMA